MKPEVGELISSLGQLSSGTEGVGIHCSTNAPLLG